MVFVQYILVTCKRIALKHSSRIALPASEVSAVASACHKHKNKK
jgi:hypothetical protein